MRRTPALAALAVLSLALTACGGGNDSDTAAVEVAKAPTFAPGTTMAKIAKTGTLQAGVKFDQPGFGMTGLSDKPQGFDVEIVKIIAAKLGIDPGHIKYTEAPSNVREEILERGEVDVVAATYTINDERKKRISFAGPYYQAGQRLMVKSGNTTITGPESLAKTKAKVCSATGSTPSENIKQYLSGSDRLVLFDNYTKCADALRTGQVDAVTTDDVVLMGLASNSNGDFKVVGPKFSKEPYGIGIAKGDVAFCRFIDDTLAEAAKSGAYTKAWKDTAGKLDKSIPVPTLAKADTCS
ncbi:glutamate ABC transporter substrate-binding protein [Streptomyces sp. NRRL B-3229]|uniref:glutamate ABC transporter substrate-binding protein n=1 Tax=Streptomyces sp. NRRL B-3229 TaxID=1463836 RepID=UPI0018FEDB94|nr:glutamate ABC transporter substrate-binding protein [Streptomyces sp. NRRL B-3229]